MLLTLGLPRWRVSATNDAKGQRRDKQREATLQRLQRIFGWCGFPGGRSVASGMLLPGLRADCQSCREGPAWRHWL